jgi:hypothetical protein
MSECFSVKFTTVCKSIDAKIKLTADVVAGTSIRVATGAAKVELESVALVSDQVGVSV